MTKPLDNPASNQPFTDQPSNVPDMQQIVGIDYDVSQLPKGEDLLRSSLANAVQYRQALARASNAIEGVVLTEQDKAFMSDISLNIGKEDFKKALLAHLKGTRALDANTLDSQRQGGQ